MSFWFPVMGKRGRYGGINIEQNGILADTQPLEVLSAKMSGFREEKWECLPNLRLLLC